MILCKVFNGKGELVGVYPNRRQFPGEEVDVEGLFRAASMFFSQFIKSLPLQLNVVSYKGGEA